MSDEQQQATVKWATIDAAIQEIGRLQEQVAVLRNEVRSWRACDQKLHVVDAVRSRRYNLARELRKDMVATDSVGVLNDQQTDKHGNVLFDGMFTELRWLREQNAVLRSEVEAWRYMTTSDKAHKALNDAIAATDAAGAMEDK